jgi:hypothetical protein
MVPQNNVPFSSTEDSKRSARVDVAPSRTESSRGMQSKLLQLTIS